MKKFLSLVMICLLLLCSCGKKKQQDDDYGRSKYLRPVTMELSEHDTLQIMEQEKEYMASFSKNDFETASHMLYNVHNDSVSLLPEKARKEFVRAMQNFTVYDCKVSEFILREEKNNEVKLAVQIIKDGNLETGEGVTHFSLNPVRKDNTWYLTVLDENAEGVANAYK